MAKSLQSSNCGSYIRDLTAAGSNGRVPRCVLSLGSITAGSWKVSRSNSPMPSREPADYIKHLEQQTREQSETIKSLNETIKELRQTVANLLLQVALIKGYIRLDDID